jgi:hypothetical protein
VYTVSLVGVAIIAWLTGITPPSAAPGNPRARTACRSSRRPPPRSPRPSPSPKAACPLSPREAAIIARPAGFVPHTKKSYGRLSARGAGAYVGISALLPRWRRPDR